MLGFILAFSEIIESGRRHHGQKVSHVRRAWSVGNFTQIVILKGKLLCCGDVFWWHKSFNSFLWLNPYEATTCLWIFGKNPDFSKTKSKHQSLKAVLQQLSYMHRPRHQCSEHMKPRKADCKESLEIVMWLWHCLFWVFPMKGNGFLWGNWSCTGSNGACILRNLSDGFWVPVLPLGTEAIAPEGASPCRECRGAGGSPRALTVWLLLRVWRGSQRLIAAVGRSVAFFEVQLALLHCRSYGRIFLYGDINIKPGGLHIGEEETIAPSQPAHVIVPLAQWSPVPKRQQGSETML